MKRTLSLALAALLCCLSAAADELSVTQGNFKQFKSGGNIYATLDFDGATFDNKYPLSEEYPNLNITSQTVEMPLNIILSNSFGFGGTNSALVIRKME